MAIQLQTLDYHQGFGENNWKLYMEAASFTKDMARESMLLRRNRQYAGVQVIDTKKNPELAK